jgi:hypothetical protein
MRLHRCSAYQSFHAQQNHLEGGVEPPSVVTLLVPSVGVGEELEPKPADSMVAFAPAAPWSAVFPAASSAVIFTTTAFTATTLSAAAFTIMASSVAFAVTTSSTILTLAAFSAVVDAATEASLVVGVDLSPSEPSGIVDVTALAAGYIYPRDLDALGLVTPLPHCDVDIIQHG